MPESPLSFSLDLALSGKGAPPQAAYKKALADADAPLAWLRQQHRDGALELLGIPTATADVKAAAKLVPGIIQYAQERWRCWESAAPAWEGRRSRN